MKILAQTHRMPHDRVEHEYEAIKRSGHEYVSYGYKTGRHGITLTGIDDIYPDELCYARCSTQLLTSNIMGYYPESFKQSIDYDENTFKVNSAPESECNINITPGCYRVLRLIECLDRQNIVDTFYKPNNDRKLIDGVIVRAGSTLRESINVDVSKFLQAEFIVSTNILNIREEVRCYVVNRKVITASLYRRNNKYDITLLSDNELSEYIEVAQMYVDNYYAPSDNFTIDVCTTIDGLYRIVEYNALNSSGLYNCDTRLLFDALEIYMMEKQ